MKTILVLLSLQLPPGQSVPPKDGEVHIVLHHMPAGLTWVLALKPDPISQFLARDLDTSKPPPARIIELKISDGRVDIDLSGSHNLFMNANMPSHTKIFVETDDGKQIYQDEITERLRVIANGVEAQSQEQPIRRTIIKPSPQ